MTYSTLKQIRDLRSAVAPPTLLSCETSRRLRWMKVRPGRPEKDGCLRLLREMRPASTGGEWGRGLGSKAPPLRWRRPPAVKPCRPMEGSSVTLMEAPMTPPTIIFSISQLQPLHQHVTKQPPLIGWSTNQVFSLRRSRPVVRNRSESPLNKVWPPPADPPPLRPRSPPPSSTSSWLQLWSSWPVWSGFSWSRPATAAAGCLAASTWRSDMSTAPRPPEERPGETPWTKHFPRTVRDESLQHIVYVSV